MKNLRIGLFFLAALSSGAAFGCRTMDENAANSNKSVSANSTSTGSRSASSDDNAAAATALDSDPRTVIKNALTKLSEQKSWSADMETIVESTPQAKMKSQVSYNAPNTFQVVTNVNNTSMEVLIFGDEAFIKINNKWQKAPQNFNGATLIESWRKMYADVKPELFRNIQSVGNENINDQETAVYTYETDLQETLKQDSDNKMSEEVKKKMSEMDMESKNKMYVNKSNNLPVRVETTTKMMTPTKSESKIVINYDYSKPVNIEKPKVD